MRDRLRALRRNVDTLFSRRVQLKLIVVFVGRFITSLGDLVGVAAVLPLVEAMLQPETDSPVLAWVKDALGDPSQPVLILLLFAVMLGGFTGKAVANLGFGWWVNGFLAKQAAQKSVDMLAAYLAAPYTWQRQRTAAQLMRGINDLVNWTYSGLVIVLVGAGSEALTLIMLLTILLVIMPVPTVLAVAYFGLAAVVISRLVRRRQLAMAEREVELSLDVNRILLQAVYGFREARLADKSDDFVEELRVVKYEGAVITRTAAFLKSLPSHLTEILFLLGLGGLASLIFSGNSVVGGVTHLAVFAAAATRMLPSLNALLGNVAGYRASKPGTQALLHELYLLRLNTEPPAVGAGEPYRMGDIVAEDVSYRYPGTDKDVLRNVSFTMREGETLAIVGPSGAGKTTLVDVLLALIRPDAGTLTVGGRPVHDDPRMWQALLGVVPQDVVLFPLTIRQNIAFGESDAVIDEERMREAIDLAQLATFIEGLPEGLDTMLGERGARLSGGQRQRVGIARALYRRPSLLVLDEATSALDNETEYQFTETIRQLQGQVSMVVIAHRLSTVRHCDRLVFMSEGRVVASGTFEEVQSTNAQFARLVALASLEGQPAR